MTDSRPPRRSPHDSAPSLQSAKRSHAHRTAPLAVAPNAAAKLIAAPKPGTQEQPMADDINATDPIITLAAEVRRRARLADFGGARAALKELEAVDRSAAAFVEAEVFGADDEEGWTR